MADFKAANFSCTSAWLIKGFNRMPNANGDWITPTFQILYVL